MKEAYSGAEPVTAPGIHDLPRTSPQAPFTPQQLKGIGTAMRYRFLADVLYAVAGIEVLGQTPFAGLANWAQELEDRADEAYLSAFHAQRSANYANSQLIVLTGGGLASDVPGGVALFADFNGSAATNLGADFTRTSTGSGGGNFGPNGDGLAVWKKSGGQDRWHYDRHNTALATDYQAILVLMANPPQNPYLGGDAYTYLRGRINAADDTWVYCRIGNNDLQVGCVVSGATTIFETIEIETNPGDVWLFVVGTDIDDREFIVKQNGITVWRDIDDAAVSQLGSGYRYVGLGNKAANRAFLVIPFADQTRPGDLDMWTAADRLATSI